MMLLNSDLLAVVGGIFALLIVVYGFLRIGDVPLDTENIDWN